MCTGLISPPPAGFGPREKAAAPPGEAAHNANIKMKNAVEGWFVVTRLKPRFFIVQTLILELLCSVCWLVLTILLSQFVSVECRTATAGQRANRRAFFAADQTADGRATAGTHRDG